MSLLIVGMDNFDYKGKNRLSKLLNKVQPDNILLNGTIDEFREAHSIYCKIEKLIIDHLDNDYLNNENILKISKFNEISSYTPQCIADYILNSESLVYFTDISNNYNSLPLLVKDNDKNIDINKVSNLASITLKEGFKYLEDARYGQLSALALDKKPKTATLYSDRELNEINKTVSLIYKKEKTTIYLVDAITLFESDQLFNSLKKYNPHKLSLEDLDIY